VKVILQTTLEHIRRNRRSSLAVMMAVLLSATMLCSFCIFGFAFWDAMVGRMRFSEGDWHGELFANTPGEMLPYLEGNPAVEAVPFAWATLSVRVKVIVLSDRL
jgi:putative ABC transport system permease protein